MIQVFWYLQVSVTSNNSSWTLASVSTILMYYDMPQTCCRICLYIHTCANILIWPALPATCMKLKNYEIFLAKNLQQICRAHAVRPYFFHFDGSCQKNSWRLVQLNGNPFESAISGQLRAITFRAHGTRPNYCQIFH